MLEINKNYTESASRWKSICPVIHHEDYSYAALRLILNGKHNSKLFSNHLSQGNYLVNRLVHAYFPSSYTAKFQNHRYPNADIIKLTRLINSEEFSRPTQSFYNKNNCSFIIAKL